MSHNDQPDDAKRIVGISRSPRTMKVLAEVGLLRNDQPIGKRRGSVLRSPLTMEERAEVGVLRTDQPDDGKRRGSILRSPLTMEERTEVGVLRNDQSDGKRRGSILRSPLTMKERAEVGVLRTDQPDDGKRRGSVLRSPLTMKERAEVCVLRTDQSDSGKRNGAISRTPFTPKELAEDRLLRKDLSDDDRSSGISSSFFTLEKPAETSQLLQETEWEPCIYAFGGCRGNEDIPVECYKIAEDNDDWMVADLYSNGSSPIAGCSHLSSVAVTHKHAIWLTGGLTNGRPTDKVYRYELQHLCWWLRVERKGPMLEPRVHHGMVEFQGNLFVVGGFNGQEVRSTTEWYDDDMNIWRKGARMRHPRSQFGIAVHQDRIYVAGGNYETPLSSVEFCNGRTWCLLHGKLNKRRIGLTLCNINDVLYVVGGDKGETKTILRSKSPFEKWEKLENSALCLSQTNISATSHDGVIYLINASLRSSKLYCYSTTKRDGWRQRGKLQANRKFAAIVMASSI